MFDVVQYLQSHNIKKIRVNVDKIQACCPFHDDKNPSLSINTSKLLWYCFGCGEGGHLSSFIARLDNIPLKLAKEKLGFPINTGCLKGSRQDLSVNLMYEIFQKGERRFVPKFLVDKGITEDDMERFNIRVMLDSAKIFLENKRYINLFGWVLFGFYDWQNKFVGFSARYVSSKNKIFWQPSIIARKFLWGEWLLEDKDKVVLVEGIFDAIFLHKNKIPSLALSGTNLNDTKINRLMERGIKNIFIFLDPDAEIKAKVMSNRLNLLGIKSSIIKANSDPDELKPDQINNLREIYENGLKKDLTRL